MRASEERDIAQHKAEHKDKKYHICDIMRKLMKKKGYTSVIGVQ